MVHFSDIKYIDKYESWFEMWYKDKQNMLSIMVDNINADLKTGYNPLGNSIKSQIEMISAYKTDIENTLDKFVQFDNDSKIERWCYHDMLKRGVIE